MMRKALHAAFIVPCSFLAGMSFQIGWALGWMPAFLIASGLGLISIVTVLNLVFLEDA